MKSLMDFDTAIRVLRDGGEFVAVAEAMTVVLNSPQATLEHLLLGLPYPGFTSEQAALALYRRTGRPYPPDPMRLETDPELWAQVIKEHRQRTEPGTPKQPAGSAS